jgi:hypothetical protein
MIDTPTETAEARRDAFTLDLAHRIRRQEIDFPEAKRLLRQYDKEHPRRQRPKAAGQPMPAEAKR